MPASEPGGVPEVLPCAVEDRDTGEPSRVGRADPHEHAQQVTIEPSRRVTSASLRRPVREQVQQVRLDVGAAIAERHPP